MRKPFIIYVFVILFAGCMSQYNARSPLPEKQILFGQGGGFAGKTTTYRINDQGQVFQSSPYTSSQEQVNTISRKRCKKLFLEAEKAYWDTLNIDRPGNIYYFIEIRNRQDTHRIVWGATNYKVSPQVQLFYEQLLNVTKP